MCTLIGRHLEIEDELNEELRDKFFELEIGFGFIWDDDPSAGERLDELISSFKEVGVPASLPISFDDLRAYAIKCNEKIQDILDPANITKGNRND